MTDEEIEAECLSLIGKAQQLQSQALASHDKREKRRLLKEARNLEKLAAETLEKINGKTNTSTASDNE